MTELKVIYQTENSHGNRDSIDKAGLSWIDLNTTISVYEAESAKNRLNVEVLIQGSHYLEVMKQHRDLVKHFDEHGVGLEKTSYPEIIQEY